MKKAQCKTCDGTGQVDSGAPGPQGHLIEIRCPDCNGTGFLVMEKVRVVKLTYGNQMCVWDNIEAAIEDVELFWSETDDDEEIELNLRFESMPKEDHENLPEFTGW